MASPGHQSGFTLHRAGVWLALAVGLLSANPGAAMRQFGTSDGLVPNSSYAIVRDDLGFLWTAADSGLNRFDGRRFVAPAASISAGLEGTVITTMASDGHILWIGTRSDGLRRVDLRRETVDAIPPSANGVPATAIRALAIDAQHSVWLATDGAGVVRLEWLSGKPRYTGYLPGTGGLPHERVWSIATDGTSILVATQDGAARLKPGDRKFEFMPFAAPFPAGGRANIEKFIGDGRGGYWIGTWDHGLFHANASGVRRIEAEGSTGSLRITSLALVDGEPMVGFDVGIARYVAGCDCLRGIPLSSGYDTLSQITFVRSLLAMDDGGVYVGTWGNGIFHVPANAAVFQALRPLQPSGADASTRRVQAALEDRSGHLWVGSFGSGLQRSRQPLAGASATLESVPIQSNRQSGAQLVWVIEEDRAGRIWVGSDAGLDRLDPRSGTWRHIADTHEQGGLPGLGVRDLLELESGEMLVATSSGLARVGIDDRAFTVEYAPTGPNHALAKTISAMSRDRRGRTWLATYSGVYILDPELKLLHVLQKPQLPQDLVRDLLEDGHGQMLMAAGRLCRIDTRVHDLAAVSPHCEERELGLPHDDIQAIQADVEGAIWLSSLHGLRRLLPDQGPAQAFHAADGLIADEFAPGASHAGKSGRLYFGSAYGLQIFDPRSALAPRQLLKPMLTEIRVGGRTLGAGDIGAGAMIDAAPPYATRLQLPAGKRDILLGFELLGASRVEQRLQYRIDGLHDWLPAAEDGVGNYLNLPAGDYTLYLRVHENGLPAGSERELLAVHVAPFWWERTLVQILVLLTALTAGWLLYRNRIISLRNNQRLLKSQVALRTREIEQQKFELAQANRQLYELSIRDGLTGVFNRRHSLDEARRILREQGDHEICIALIDLDHFKLINDRFGHVAGDEALRCFCGWLKAQAGPGDVVGRYGGEEFFCLLFDRDVAQASHWANQLLARVRTTQIAGPNCDIKITASIGLVAVESRVSLPLEVWIARADAALYRAKENGRDQALLG